MELKNPAVCLLDLHRNFLGAQSHNQISPFRFFNLFLLCNQRFALGRSAALYAYSWELQAKPSGSSINPLHLAAISTPPPPPHPLLLFLLCVQHFIFPPESSVSLLMREVTEEPRRKQMLSLLWLSLSRIIKGSSLLLFPLLHSIMEQTGCWFWLVVKTQCVQNTCWLIIVEMWQRNATKPHAYWHMQSVTIKDRRQHTYRTR